MSGPLILSLFPGIGLLDMAFEEEGFCVVRGPDLLWGGDIRRFHPPADKFDGVIGGPPCQLFSSLRHLNKRAGLKHGNMIPEYERCVTEARPGWFVMENVPEAPEPSAAGYIVKSTLVTNRLLGSIQDRTRRFSFGTRDGIALMVESSALEPIDYSEAVTSSMRDRQTALARRRQARPDGSRPGPNYGPRVPVFRMLELQGLPGTWLDETAFTENAKRIMIGNGVPLPMGRAIAKAVRRAVSR